MVGSQLFQPVLEQLLSCLPKTSTNIGLGSLTVTLSMTKKKILISSFVVAVAAGMMISASFSLSWEAYTLPEDPTAYLSEKMRLLVSFDACTLDTCPLLSCSSSCETTNFTGWASIGCSVCCSDEASFGGV